jgi:uncharacterized protein DUF3298
MKVKSLAIFLIVLVISSCKWGVAPQEDAAITTDTLHYIYKVIKQRSADCGSKPDSGCTVAKISYPYFKGQQRLNDSVARKLTLMFVLSEKPDTNLTQLITHFFANYERDKHTAKDPTIFSLDCSASVLRQDSSLATVQLYGTMFQGGAHPGSGTYFINWNTKANKSITLNDLFINDYKDKLCKIAESIFRKNEKLADSTSLSKDYFFKDNKFALNNNFLVTPIGIRVLYNEYEIKPYSAGTTDLFIPYTQIKELLRPNTVVAQYVK